MNIAKMNSTTLYIATNQILLKADPNNFGTWMDLYRLTPYLRNSLCCVVCGNLLIHPYTPASGRCQHHVCEKCKDGRKKIKPTCSWCKDCKQYTENITLHMLLQCYKRMCKLIMTSRIYTKLYISAKKGIAAVGVERGAANLMSLIREGAALQDHFRLNQQISKSPCTMLPCLYTNTSSHSLLMASAEINRLLNNNAISTGTLYPTHSGINSNMLKRKRRDFYHDAESRLHMQQRLKLDKDVVAKNATSSKMVVNHNGEIYGSDQNQPQPRVNKEKVFKRPSVVRMEVKLRRGCRCGNATPTPGKLTCCGQRCPCYVENKSCINCRCKGCRNPHHLDGSKGICFKSSSANRMNSNHIRSEKQYTKDATLHNSISTNVNTNQQNGLQTPLRIIEEPGSTRDINFQDLIPINANIASGQNLNNHIKQKLAASNDTYSRNLITNKIVKNFKRAQASNQFNEKKPEAERSRCDVRNDTGINKPTIFTNSTNDMLPSNIESNVYALVSQNSSHSINSQNNSYVSISLNNSYGSTSLNNSNPFTSQSNSHTSIPIKHYLGSSKSNLQQTLVSNLRKTSSESCCNCGHGSAIPDKSCYNDPSCPCFVKNKSCHKCQCGVRCLNPSLEDLIVTKVKENESNLQQTLVSNLRKTSSESCCNCGHGSAIPDKSCYNDPSCPCFVKNKSCRKCQCGVRCLNPSLEDLIVTKVKENESKLQQTLVSNLRKTSSESCCNCGHGSAIPDKSCYNDPSCPCFVKNKSCRKCQCGVRCLNPSLEDLIVTKVKENESPEYNDYDIGNIPDTDRIQDRATVEMDSVSSAESFDNIDSGESNFFEDVYLEMNSDVNLDRLLNIKQEPEFKLEHADTLKSKPYTSTGTKQIEFITLPSLDSFKRSTNLKLDVDEIFVEEPIQKNAMESSNKLQKSKHADTLKSKPYTSTGTKQIEFITLPSLDSFKRSTNLKLDVDEIFVEEPIQKNAMESSNKLQKSKHADTLKSKPYTSTGTKQIEFITLPSLDSFKRSTNLKLDVDEIFVEEPIQKNAMESSNKLQKSKHADTLKSKPYTSTGTKQIEFITLPSLDSFKRSTNLKLDVDEIFVEEPIQKNAMESSNKLQKSKHADTLKSKPYTSTGTKQIEFITLPSLDSFKRSTNLKLDVDEIFVEEPIQKNAMESSNKLQKSKHADTLKSKPYTSTGTKQIEFITLPSLDSFKSLTNLKLDVDEIFDEEPIQKNAMESSNKLQKSTRAFGEPGTSMESVSDNLPATKVTSRSRAPVKRSREMGHEEYEVNKLPTSKFIAQSTNANQKNLDKFKEPFFFSLATSGKNGSDKVKKVLVKSGTASLVSILSDNKASMRAQQQLEISDETYSNVAVPKRLVTNTVNRNQSSIKQELGCPKDTISKNFLTYKSAVFSNANSQINNKVKQKPGTNKTVPSQTSTSNVGVNSIPRTERRVQIKQKVTIGRGNGIKRVVPTKLEIKLKRGCRCGTATRNPGKLTCCGQRCPCYVENRACLECHCKGCRNPHRADGSKVPTQASQMEYLSAISRQTPQKQNLQPLTQCIPPGFKLETLTLEQFRESLKNANLAFVNPSITPHTIVIDDRCTDDGDGEDNDDDDEIEVDY